MQKKTKRLKTNKQKWNRNPFADGEDIEFICVPLPRHIIILYTLVYICNRNKPFHFDVVQSSRILSGENVLAIAYFIKIDTLLSSRRARALAAVCNVLFTFLSYTAVVSQNIK